MIILKKILSKFIFNFTSRKFYNYKLKYNTDENIKNNQNLLTSSRELVNSEIDKKFFNYFFNYNQFVISSSDDNKNHIRSKSPILENSLGKSTENYLK